MLQDGLPDWQCQCWVVIAQISLAVVMGCLGRGETVTGTALQPLPGLHCSVLNRPSLHGDCDAVRSTQCQTNIVKFSL